MNYNHLLQIYHYMNYNLKVLKIRLLQIYHYIRLLQIYRYNHLLR